MQPDPLVALWATIKTAVWFVLGVPQVLWNKPRLFCWPREPCEPFSPMIAAAIASVIMLVALWYLWFAWLSRSAGRDALRCLVIAEVLLGINTALPPLYDGLQLAISRADNRAGAQERWQRDHPPPSRVRQGI